MTTFKKDKAKFFHKVLSSKIGYWKKNGHKHNNNLLLSESDVHALNFLLSYIIKIEKDFAEFKDFAKEAKE